LGPLQSALLLAEDPKKKESPEDKDTSPGSTPPEPDDEDKKSKEADKKPQPEHYHVVVTPENFFDVSTLPLRMLVHRTALWFMNFMIPSLEFNWKDFCRGAEEAVKAVHEHLASGDVNELDGLVTRSLMEELQKDASPHEADKEEWSQPPRLLDVNVVALFSSRAVPPNEDTDASGIVLTPLVKVHEEYRYKSSEQPRHTIRLLKWEFELRIPTDGMPTDWRGDGWKISSLEKSWFLRKVDQPPKD